MDYQAFLALIKESVAACLGNTVVVQLNHVYKNNGIELDGIVILENGNRVSPNIYLNSYYEQHLKGRKTEHIVDEIISLSRNREGAYSDIFRAFEELALGKDDIIFRLVNYEKNKALLETVPHIRFLDLAVTFHVLMREHCDSIATVRVTNELLEKWGTTVRKLMSYAAVNTPALFPARITPMAEVMREMIEKDLADMIGSMANERNISREDLLNHLVDEVGRHHSAPMYVLTNQKEINGASAMLYQQVLEEFAEEAGSDLYILPSSIHEVILVPVTIRMKKEELMDMVLDVNITQVPEEEILSDRVYCYHRESRSFDY